LEITFLNERWHVQVSRRNQRRHTLKDILRQDL